MPTYRLRRTLRPDAAPPEPHPTTSGRVTPQNPDLDAFPDAEPASTSAGSAPGAAPDDARTEDGSFEARDDAEAIGIAQAEADRADGALAWVELTDAAGRRVWGLRRGETLSRRPDGM